MSVSTTHLGGLPIAPGDVLQGKYRLERLIGEGGAGIVVSAIHIQLEQRVAIKFLRRAIASDELRTRFEREARAIAKIESEHVVLVLETGALDDGEPYMVMEHLDGRDLARVLREDGPLPVEVAVDCMMQVCEALEKAHSHGIVHRDLKPANVLLTWDSDGSVHVKVVDFGISKFLDKKLLEGGGNAHEVTVPFTTLGSPRYMAPEQCRNSKDVDGRADLWSVGAVLFHLITGKYAFEADGNVAAAIAVLADEPLDLCSVAAHVPPGLGEVVRRCLTKDVAARFQTAADLADALQPYASAVSDEVPRQGPVRVTSSERPPVDAGPGSVALPSGRRDADTERRLRASGAPVRPSGAPSAFRDGGGALPEPRGARSALAVVAGVLFVLAVAFGALVLSRRHAFTPRHVLQAAGAPRAVPLDAGRTNP